MSSSSKLRMLGYAGVLAMHISNIRYMEARVESQSDTTDERIIAFKGLGGRFFTTWNVMLQLAYASLSLTCDVLHTFNKKMPLLQHLDRFRETMFASLVWPCALVVSSIFWTVFKYDRSLIFPEYFDIMLPKISNQVIHTIIVPVVLFELVFRPRIAPVSHRWNVLILTIYMAVYLGVLVFTHLQRGVWLYPVFEQLYGTAYLFVALVVLYSFTLICYYIQWPLTKTLQLQEAKKTPKARKRRKEF